MVSRKVSGKLKFKINHKEVNFLLMYLSFEVHI